jgi:hypothetical protein
MFIGSLTPLAKALTIFAAGRNASTQGQS